MKCIFGHVWYYDAITEQLAPGKRIICPVGCCTSIECKKIPRVPYQKARKHCIKCLAMREENLINGIFKIEHGQLLPDLKAWANF